MVRGNYFDLLGLSMDATDDQIQDAYHCMARKYHPDIYLASGNDTSLKDVDFVEITRAYNTLKDRAKRDAYREFLRKRGNTPRSEEQGPDQRAEHTRLEMARNAYQRGMAEMRQKRFQSAKELFQTAVHHDPIEPEYYTMLGLAIIEAGMGFSMAEMNCEKAISLSPCKAQLHANLGKIYLKSNIKSQARKKFNDALHWDPNNRDAREGLSVLEHKPSFWQKFTRKK